MRSSRQSTRPARQMVSYSPCNVNRFNLRRARGSAAAFYPSSRTKPKGLHVIPNKPQRFYTSSRTKPKGLHVIPNKPKGLHVIPNKPKARVRDPPVCCNPSLARGFLASDGMTESTSPLKLLAQAKPYFCVAWSDLTTPPPRFARLLGGARVSLYNPPFDPPFAQVGQDKGVLSIMTQAGFPCAAGLNLPTPRLMGKE